MLKRLIAVCLSFVLICSSFSRLCVFVGFEANTKYIAETLCVNKSRPWMNCHGKCYLMNKVKQAQEKESKQERQNAKSLYQDAYLASGVRLSIKPITFNADYPEQVVPKLSHRVIAIFQPPKIIRLQS